MTSSLSSSLPGAVPWPAAPFEPLAPVRLGVIVNPKARLLREENARRALRAAAPGALWAETSSLSELRAAVERLTLSGVNVITAAGGDGALHFLIQELLRHELRWPGVVLVLQGGTLNIVARQLNAALSPARQLALFQEGPGRGRFGSLQPRRLPLLRVEGERVPARYGFIFGSEVVKNSLELYDGFGGGYEGLTRFLFEVGRGYLLNTPLWQQECWRLDPPPFGLQVTDAQRARSVPAYSAAIACTLDLAIAGGAIRALRRRPEDRGFFARVITETRTGPLLKMIPALMRGVSLEGVVDVSEATQLALHGAFTLDGECFGVSSRHPELPAPIRVEPAGDIALLLEEMSLA